MPPTTLLAAPHLRLAGLRAPTHRVERAVGVRARRGGARFVLLGTIVLVVLGALGFLRVWPPLATVMSASMAPTINTGDIVVLKRLDGAPRVGDIVMVQVPDEARSRYGYPPVVIHRVATIAPDGTVRTKGDAKRDVDPFTVPRTAITTRVLTHIPAAGRAFSFLGSTLGLLWLAGGAALFFLMPLVERSRERQRREASEREERERVIDEALREAAATQAELRALTAGFAAQLSALPARIEAAVASGVAPTAAPVVDDATAAEPEPAVGEQLPLLVVAPTAVATPAPEADTPPVTRRIGQLTLFAPRSGAGLVPASQWRAPARTVSTPDLMAVFATPPVQLVPAPWDALPPALTHRDTRGVLCAAH